MMLLSYIFNFALLFFLFLNGNVTSHSVNQRKELLCLLINNKYFAGYLPKFFPEDETKLFNNPEVLDALSKSCTDFNSSHDVSTHYTDLVCKYFDNAECAVESQEYFNGCALVPKSCLMLKTVPLFGYEGYHVSTFEHQQLLSFLYLYRNADLVGALGNRRVRYLPETVEKAFPYSNLVYNAQYQLDVSVSMGLLLDSFAHGNLYTEATNFCIVDKPELLLLLRDFELLFAKFVFNYGLHAFDFKGDGLNVVGPGRYLKGYRSTRYDIQLVAKNVFADNDYLTIVELLGKGLDPLTQYLVKLTPVNQDFANVFVRKFFDDIHFSAVRVSNLNKDEIPLSEETTKFLTELCFNRETDNLSIAACFFNRKKHKVIAEHVGGVEYYNVRAHAILEREGRTTNEKEKGRSKLGQWWRDLVYRLRYGVPSLKFWERTGWKNAVRNVKHGLKNARDTLTFKKYRKEGGLKRDKERLKAGLKKAQFWKSKGFKEGVENAKFWNREGFQQGVENAKLWKNEKFTGGLKKAKAGLTGAVLLPFNKCRGGKCDEAAPLLEEGGEGDVVVGDEGSGIVAFEPEGGVDNEGFDSVGEKLDDAGSAVDSGFGGSGVGSVRSHGGDLLGKHHVEEAGDLGETVGDLAVGGED